MSNSIQNKSLYGSVVKNLLSVRREALCKCEHIQYLLISAKLKTDKIIITLTKPEEKLCGLLLVQVGCQLEKKENRGREVIVAEFSGHR